MDLTAGEFGKSTGPLLIVTTLSWGLLGVLTVQVFLYSQAFPNDRSRLKAAVYGIYLLEIAQTIMLTVYAWEILVTGFRRNDSFFPVGVSWVPVCLLGGATAMVAQTFYAYRIMIISESKIIPSFIMLMSLTSFTAAVVVGVLFKQAGNFFRQLHALERSSFIGVWIGTSSVCDIVIAACMCFYLSRRIQDRIFPKTQALVFRAMRMTVEAGALTASVSIVSMAMFYATESSGLVYYAVVPITALAKLYSNAMLALLNSRIKLGRIAESTSWCENELLPIPLSHPRQTDDVEIKSSSNPSEIANAIGTTGEVIAMDEVEVQ